MPGVKSFPLGELARWKFAAVLALVCFAPVTVESQVEDSGLNSSDTPVIGAPLLVKERRLELSGCAVVEGGVLVVEDELIGAVLLLESPRSESRELTTVKLERKKKARAPFADAFKLFPFQDFEDIASDGVSQVYLIGSHHGKDGERRPDREFLFQAEWDGRDRELKVVGEQYGLLDRIAPVLEELGCGIGLSKTAVSPALNIEGLALHGPSLYIGLRAPVTPDGEAILLTIPTVSAFEAEGVVEAVTLPLNGGGIRALDWDAVGGRLLVLSGSADETAGGAPQAALWAWTPESKALTKLLDFPPDLARKGPEGVCRLPEHAGGKLLVVLDGEDGGAGAELLEIDG